MSSLNKPFTLGQKKTTRSPDYLSAAEQKFVNYYTVMETPDPFTAARKAGVGASDVEKWVEKKMRLPRVIQAIQERQADFKKKTASKEWIEEQLCELVDNPEVADNIKVQALDKLAKIKKMYDDGAQQGLTLQFNVVGADGQPVIIGAQQKAIEAKNET